jgi:hypothetical protein
MALRVFIVGILSIAFSRSERGDRATKAFDDRETLRRYLDETGMPASWEGWIGEQFFVD